MNYILVAIIAWALFGVLSVLDKFLLDKPIHDAGIYTFYTGIFSIFSAIIFLPFARFGAPQHLIFDLLCGLIYLAAQYCLFRAIIGDDISRVIPITGALTPIFSLVIVSFGLKINISGHELLAFGVLVLGTFLISYQQGKLTRRLFWPLLSSLLFAAYYSLVKNAYAPFAQNYAWVRLGSVIGAVLMLFAPELRRHVFKLTRGIKEKTSALFIAKEVVGGGAFIVLNYAIVIGNPAIINSLQGFEFMLVFVLALLLSKYYPKILKERESRALIIQKFAAIVVLFAGLLILELK